MSKTLIILNSFYPFARHEDFLANEIDYIKGFDKVIVAPNSIHKPQPQPLYNTNPKHTYVINENPYKRNIIRLALQIVFSSYFYCEIANLIKKRKFCYSCIRNLISFLLYSLNSYNTINKHIKENCNNEDIYLYSYWMHASAFIACLLRKNNARIVKVITRCHGFDLYEYRSPKEYIPFREFIFKYTDEIHSISKDGIEYLTDKYPYLKDKLVLSRLGTKKYDFIKHDKNKPLRIVSCSWVRKVKRIDMIIDALAECQIDIEWTHFGDGEDLEDIRNKAHAINKPNVRINLPGALSNKEVIKEYNKKKFDVFINVSSSEGIPVSIMEAASMGMVVVATAVGGTPEVVDKDNGFLLDKDFNPSELAGIIKHIANSSEEQYTKMSLASRKKWEDAFSADNNYPLFFSNLLKN